MDTLRAVIRLCILAAFVVGVFFACSADAAIHNFTDQMDAKSACEAGKASASGRTYPAPFPPDYIFQGFSQACVHNVGNKRYTCAAGFGRPGAGMTFVRGCESPEDNDDRYNYTVVLNCGARNTDPAQMPGPRLRGPNYSTSRCIGGCVLQDGGVLDRIQGSDGHGNPIHWERVSQSYTGAECPSPEHPAVTDPDPPANPDGSRCDPAGGGYTQCAMKDGKHCINTPSGKSFCWTEGQTGTQVNAPQTAVRTVAPSQPVPPDAVPGTVTQLGNTTTVTQNGVTTITNIYNAAPDNGSDDGEGVEDEDGDSANSSGDCAAQPACSGGDAIGCAILRQQWRTTCSMAGDGTEPRGFGTGATTLVMDGEGIVREEDAGGWFDDLDGGWAPQGSCPIEFGFSYAGTFHEMDSVHLCTLLQALAGLILLVGHIHAAMIISSGFRKGG